LEALEAKQADRGSSQEHIFRGRSRRFKAGGGSAGERWARALGAKEQAADNAVGAIPVGARARRRR